MLYCLFEKLHGSKSVPAQVWVVDELRFGVERPFAQDALTLASLDGGDALHELQSRESAASGEKRKGLQIEHAVVCIAQVCWLRVD